MLIFESHISDQHDTQGTNRTANQLGKKYIPIKKLVRPCNYNADNQGDFHLYFKDKKHGL